MAWVDGLDDGCRGLKDRQLRDSHEWFKTWSTYGDFIGGSPSYYPKLNLWWIIRGSIMFKLRSPSYYPKLMKRFVFDGRSMVIMATAILRKTNSSIIFPSNPESVSARVSTNLELGNSPPKNWIMCCGTCLPPMKKYWNTCWCSAGNGGMIHNDYSQSCHSRPFPTTLW